MEHFMSFNLIVYLYVHCGWANAANYGGKYQNKKNVYSFHLLIFIRYSKNSIAGHF